jgi:glucokinase
VAKTKGRASIGIDVGGTKTRLALFDSSFAVIEEKKFRTHPEKGGVRAFEKALKREIGHMLVRAKAEGLEVKVVGVGCAGDIDMRKGSVKTSPNLTFLDGYPFREKLQRMTGGARVFVANDVQAGLYGELRRGAARGARHVIGVWVGTGVGGALIIDGRLHQGATGRAGDIGNYLLHSVNISDEAPRKETLDAVASRTAIAGEAAALAAKHRAPALRRKAGTDVDDIGASDLARAIKDGDKSIEKLVRSRANVIGAALSNLVDFLNPDVVVLGGGLVEEIPALMRREVRKSIDAHAARKAAKAVKVKVAKLHRHAGTVGAALLAIDTMNGTSPIDRKAM